MKKFILLIIAIFLVITLSSCDNDNIVSEKEITYEDIIPIYRSEIRVCKIFNFLTITRLRVCNCIKIV